MALVPSGIISTTEMNVRKSVGIIGLTGVVAALMFYPSSRTAYAGLSLVVAMSVATWRMGNQSL